MFSAHNRIVAFWVLLLSKVVAITCFEIISDLTKWVF